MKSILLHGLGQGSSSWESVVRVMDNRSDILCPDLSELLNSTEPCYSNLYKALNNYCSQFDEPLNLCGLSLGGILALNYATEHSKKVNALVLIGTQASMPKRLLKFQNMIFRLMPSSAFRSMGFNKKSVINLSKSMLDLDLRQDLKQVSCPTLVIYGERDRANKAASLELNDLLQHAELMVIPNSGHEINIDAPVELGKCLNIFFNSKNKTQDLSL